MGKRGRGFYTLPYLTSDMVCRYVDAPAPASVLPDLTYLTCLLLSTFLTYLTNGYLILQGYSIFAVILGWNIWPSFWTYLLHTVAFLSLKPIVLKPIFRARPLLFSYLLFSGPSLPT